MLTLVRCRDERLYGEADSASPRSSGAAPRSPWTTRAFIAICANETATSA